MDFGLIAPALIGGAMAIVGAIIVAWMNAHKPTLELPAKEEAQTSLPFEKPDPARSKRIVDMVFLDHR